MCVWGAVGLGSGVFQDSSDEMGRRLGLANTPYRHSSSASLGGGSYQGNGGSYQGNGGSYQGCGGSYQGCGESCPYTDGVQVSGPVSTAWRHAMADLEA